MTLNCCIGTAKSTIKAIAETDAEILMIPVEKMEDWLKFKSWRSFVFESYDNRLKEMLETIDTLAFNKMDKRLYEYLKRKVIYLKTTELILSHYEIASDLNTSRVVISRLLKQLENDKKVKLHRKKIEVLKF